MSLLLELPRAVSTEKDDPRYDPLAGRVVQVDVFIDGVKQKSVSTYDMDEGFIIRAVLDADGKTQLNSARDAVLTERVEGVVTASLASRGLSDLIGD